jgi:phosphoglucomutase
MAVPCHHPRVTLDQAAGKPADPASLVDVDALIAAYYEGRPDPSDPAQRVAFGTSGHRGSSFRNAFNEAHILATTEAIHRYRVQRGYSGPLFLGRDTHALSQPATRTALSVLVAHGSTSGSMTATASRRRRRCRTRSSSRIDRRTAGATSPTGSS